MAIGVYEKMNKYFELILSAMLYIHFLVMKVSKEILGLDVNTTLVRNLLLTITLLFIHIYLEEETKGVKMINAGYVLG